LPQNRLGYFCAGIFYTPYASLYGGLVPGDAARPFILELNSVKRRNEVTDQREERMQYCAHAWIVQCLHYGFIKLAALNFHVELKGQVHRPHCKVK
jgi:hypothetical protein